MQQMQAISDFSCQSISDPHTSFNSSFNNIMLLQIFFILAPRSLGKCASGREPSVFGMIEPCPFYNDQPVCCGQLEIDRMVNNYISIDATFGSAGGGCDVCANNLKRFWCIYTCAPDQAQYYSIGGKANMSDPRNKSIIVEVDLINLSVAPEVACGVFSSCRRTKFVAQVSAMQTPGGFFAFQGDQAISSGQQYISFEYKEQESLVMEYLPSCSEEYRNKSDVNGSTVFWDDSGYMLRELCQCNTCDESCDAEHILYEAPSVWLGFEGTYVVMAWGWCLVFGLGMTAYQRCTRREEVPSDLKDKEQGYQVI